MDDLLTRLERLESAATPGPWSVHVATRRSRPALVRTDAAARRIYVAEHFVEQAEAALAAAARNALPALLRLARADAEFRAAALAMEAAITDAEFRAALARYNDATRETAAALAALEEAPS